MPTLADHGLRFRFNGLPLRDDDDEIYGFIEEPLWQEADLTPDQVAELDALIASHRAERPQDDPVFVRLATMDWNGVAHTHRRGKSVIEERPAVGYECSMCGSYIMAENPGDFRFYGGPANGRWYVTGGAPVWRVPIPQPVSVLHADDEPRLSMEVADYWRQGDRYVWSGRTGG